MLIHNSIPCHGSHLCLTGSLESTWESLHIVLDLALVSQKLNVGTVNQDTTFLLELDIFVSSERSEAPVFGDDNLLSARELIHGSSESLDGSSSVGVSGSDGEEDLTNVDTSDSAVWLAPGASHTGLQSIGTSARQHLVDSDDMVRVGSDSQMETFLSCDLNKVPEFRKSTVPVLVFVNSLLVGANTSSLESLGAQLLVFVGNHVDA